MKKILCLVAALALIAGCDDGDMGYKTFDFSSVEVPTACPNNIDDVSGTTETYYKVTGTEALILVLAKGALINKSTIDPITGVDTPLQITLGGSNTLTYYDFVSKPTGSLCTKSDIPPAKEDGIWTGQGTLSISTSENLDTNTGKLLGYRHTIILTNVSFNHGDEKITIVESSFGYVDKDFDFDFKFIAEGADAPVVNACDENSNLIFTMQSAETLSLNIPNFSEVFDNEIETDTISIAQNPNYVILFNVYKSTATKTNVCGQGSEVPSLPIQKWQMIDGNLLVITTETGGIYNHDIYLKDASFRNSQGDIFSLNSIVDVGANGYYFGRL
ncbi:MAG: hypothetical protein DI539_11960 [Flavobacterium psychrophilum]|nr:MAG: hypothetical protein DI539_11960 [Flavobacterium psychrophilum]